MSKLVAYATCVAVSVLAACNDSGSGDDTPIDAPIDVEDIGLCDPLAPVGMQGCTVGQKCTWIFIQDDPDSVGKIGCVPDGTVDLAGTCTRGQAGETTGFDNCKGGLICVADECKDICGFGGGAAEQCPAAESCTNYVDFWANGDDEAMYGACNPRCNPVTQLRTDGTSCGVGEGCYLLVSNTTSTAVCARAGTGAHNQVIQEVFANSCLPGHQPRGANATDQTVECGALCDVEDVFITDPANADSGNRPMPKPAAQVTNAAAEGGMAPFTCVSKGAAAASDPTSGEACRYWWAREDFDDISPFSNTVGWCHKHAVFQYDSDGNNADDSPFPRCAALSSADKVLPVGNPPHDDARYFWCKALPAMLQTSIRHVKKSIVHHQPRLDRLGWR